MGDTEYLKHFLAKNGIKTTNQTEKVLPQPDQMTEMVCKQGHVGLLEFLESQKIVSK